MNAPFRIQPDSTYTVGYGKPPVETQFKKGRSGNPRGRPPKRQRALADMINDQVERMVEIKDGVGIRWDRLMIRNLVRPAAQGEKQAVLLLFDLIEWCEHGERADDDAESIRNKHLPEAMKGWAAMAQAGEKSDQEYFAKRRIERQNGEISPSAAALPVDSPSERLDPEGNQVVHATAEPPSDSVEDMAVHQPRWPDS